MGLDFTATMVKKMVKVIEEDWDTVEQAAEAVMQAAFEMYEARAKWCVAGQLYYAPGEGYIDHQDARAAKVVLGPYATETQAQNAGRQFAIGTPTGEQFQWWSLEMWHGTPNDYYIKRKKERDARRLAESTAARLADSASETREEEPA